MNKNLKKVVFIDRDGVINQKPVKSRYVRFWDDFVWMPGAKDALALLKKNGYTTILISNQAGIGRGLTSWQDVNSVHEKMQQELSKVDGKLDALYICPHKPEDNCECRKPRPGLFYKAQNDLNVDFSDAIFIGDEKKDLEAGTQVGIKTFLVSPQESILEIVRKKILKENVGILKNILERIRAASLFWRVLVHPQKWRTLAVWGLMLAGAAFEMLMVALTIPIVDGLAHVESLSDNKLAMFIKNGINGMGWTSSNEKIILSFIILGCLLFSLRAIFMFLQQYGSIAISQKIYRDVKGDMLRLVLGGQYSEISQKNRGAILTDLTQPPEFIRRSFIMVGKLVGSFFNVMVLVGLILYLSFKLTLIFAVAGGLMMWLWRKTLPHLSSESGRVIYNAKREQSRIEIDSVDGLKVVKTNSLESKLLKQHADSLLTEKSHYLKLIFLQWMPLMVHEILASVAIIVLAILTIFVPSSGLTMPLLTAFLFSIRRIIPGLSTIASSAVELFKDKPALVVFEQLNSHTPKERIGALPFTKSIEKIEFKNASFYYPGKEKKMVINNVDLELKKGQFTTVVGPSGSGKSTLALLLVGLYDLEGGSIYFNGQDMLNLNLKDLRSHIGYLSQDVFLFNGSIEENIKLWDETISNEDMMAALEKAQIADFIKTLPNGTKTMVGDRGLRLSGGQAQRIALARVILRKPDVYIFDEATSALDNLTEEAVYKSIKDLSQNALVFVIAHRLSTIEDVDQIVVVKDGVIVEKGIHQNLLAANGTYAELYQREIKNVGN